MDPVAKAKAAETKLAMIARTRRPTGAERLEALCAYLDAAVALGQDGRDLRETIDEVRAEVARG